MAEPWTVNERSSIAVVGMAGRFPGAADVDELWRNLRDGVESIVFFTEEELAAGGVGRETLRQPGYVRARAPLDGVELFDAPLFGISPREAEMLDPQQRLFLECAFTALESAGYDAQRYEGAVGIFGGANISTYLGILYSNPVRIGSFGVYNTLLANDKDYLTTRVAYKLNLRGPAITVQTACSTSLVAVHLACQSLLHGECDLALAGGIGINLPERSGYTYEQHGIGSPDGHCRPFDARAQGTVSGSGVGIVVLKRLAAARGDGDPVLAVIRGTAVNNDGSLKISYTAPSLKAQAQVVAEALAVARVEPGTIGFVEAHGTGTSLGDPIEVAALTRAFQARTSERGFCALGSVKSNIGHLDSAAGVAGLIKAIQSLRHGEIPPTLHFESPNPQIDFANSPFFVNPKLSAWPLPGRPRRAGVTSLGIGGTNVHVVLEEGEVCADSGPARAAQLLVFSANSPAALEAVTDGAARYLLEHPDVNLADVAYTGQVGRRLWAHRRTLVAHDPREAASALEGRSPLIASLVCESRERPVCFLFSGQGAQYAGMGYGLYRSEPTFRGQVDLCAEILAEPLGLDLRRVLFAGADGYGGDPRALDSTALAQPALFTIEYALTRLWMEWGVTPRAMLGHSVGEYVAACLAGVFSLESALLLVAARGRLMQGLPGGAMLSVPLPAGEIGGLLRGEMALAAVNGPSLSVVAGPQVAIEALRQDLTLRGIEGRLLRTSHAFHSSAMEPILGDLQQEVARAGPQPGSIPYVSNLTGTWQSPEGATDAAAWARHARGTVLFGPGLEALLKEPEAVLLEVGPGDALAQLARRHPGRRPEQRVLASMRHPRNQAADLDVTLGALGNLWLAGVAVDWTGFHRHHRRHRLTLPTYPFERQRYWVERGDSPFPAAAPATEVAEGIARRPNLDWLYAPEWTRSPLAAPAPGAAGARHRWLLLLDESGCGEELARSLTAAGHEVVRVRQGAAWSREGRESFTLDPDERDHYAALVRELAAGGWFPDRLVHLWSLGGSGGAPAVPGDVPREFASLVFLAEALGRQSASHPIDFAVVTHCTQSVSGEEPLDPARAAMLGPCKVIPQEYPDIRCRLLDVTMPPAADRLLQELLEGGLAPLVALRGGARWLQTFRRLEGGGTAADGGWRQGGVYLITGGMGQIGLALAAALASNVQAKLVLIGRSPLPPREEWEEWLGAHGEADPVAHKLLALKALEQQGSEVLALAADVADREALGAAVAAARARFGTIHGVFHAAGSLDPGSLSPIQDLEPRSCAGLFRAKLGGLAALAGIFVAEPVDFLVAFSSLSTVLGGLGYAAYAAANACMDVLAHELSRTSRIPCLSIDWDAWRFGAGGERGLGAQLSDLAISPEEGVAVLERALALGAGLPQLAVSVSDLEGRIDRWVKLVTLRQTSKLTAEARHARPGLTTPYAAPATELEEALAGFWQELLGIEQVGVHDNFFDLGGHSLLGIQLNARLRRTFEIDLPLRVLFDSPTIAELAAVVESALIGDIGELTEEEAASLLDTESLRLNVESAPGERGIRKDQETEA
ncbi:MAG TPA: SDR family NAD(P)-dependent oxidoreductase [Thermoanaerobaculia bacterium]|jgi:acyl transferase domain-containing protein|nr:SDR family NAD(P)-dependent oxidoreductase [Thermoanaerobaculia bacterium]